MIQQIRGNHHGKLSQFFGTPAIVYRETIYLNKFGTHTIQHGEIKSIIKVSAI